MAPLISTDLNKLPDAVTNARPSMALGIIAFKGQKETDEVYLGGNGMPGGPVNGTKTDQGPALAAVNVYLQSTLYLAWKTAGQETVEVLQYALAQDSLPVEGKWVHLPTTTGPANPAASTDAAPAMAVGANNQLYMVWKTPGSNAPIAWSVYDGTGWSTPETIPLARTSDAPSLGGFNTSGPGNVLPLCLAWRGAESDGVYWAMFTPGSPALSQNNISGATTDASPAVAPGPPVSSGEAFSYSLIWKPKGANTLSLVPVSGKTVGTTFTLPQVQTDHGAAAVDNWNDTNGFGATVFNNLTVAFADKTGNVWRGIWAMVPDPAPFPGAGSDFRRTPDEGSNNYVFYRSNDCKLLDRVTVTVNVTTDLHCPLGFGFQLNTNSATNSANFGRCEWQQCGFILDSNGNLTSWVNNWVSTNKGPKSIDTVLTRDSSGNLKNLLYSWSTPTIPAGCTLTITLHFDQHLVVTSASFSVILPAGGGTENNHIDFASNLAITPGPGLTAADYLAPISAAQIVIVGPDNKKDADFKSGAGSIGISAADPLIAGSGRPACADGSQTLEQSNVLYGVVSSTPSASFGQTFSVAASKN